ncbi:hypothetical protein M3212_13275 [Alkalihalobacillus oceani]|uniref:hypothetical protein n=1 Tax=Halalkalibacter oceani TaxID=1653776 RepID=UPI00203B4612|nr:hypothetical protein [Halalkalibacter oceani]MCM3761743.1 hypothetical protein [Halalkalibacter oceani]
MDKRKWTAPLWFPLHSAIMIAYGRLQDEAQQTELPTSRMARALLSFHEWPAFYNYLLF